LRFIFLIITTTIIEINITENKRIHKNNPERLKKAVNGDSPKYILILGKLMNVFIISAGGKLSIFPIANTYFP
jgi:hypothetical protein